MINEGLFFEIQTKDELSIALADGIKTTSTSSTKVIMMLRNRSVSFSSSLAKAVSNQNIQVLNIGSEISSLSMRNIDYKLFLRVYVKESLDVLVVSAFWTIVRYFSTSITN